MDTRRSVKKKKVGKPTRNNLLLCKTLRHSLPIPLIGIEQVLSAKLLGVIFCSNLKFYDHVKNVLTICSQRCYLLRCLKGQGLHAKELNIVFCAIVMSRIL